MTEEKTKVQLKFLQAVSGSHIQGQGHLMKLSNSLWTLILFPHMIYSLVVNLIQWISVGLMFPKSGWSIRVKLGELDKNNSQKPHWEILIQYVEIEVLKIFIFKRLPGYTTCFKMWYSRVIWFYISIIALSSGNRNQYINIDTSFSYFNFYPVHEI